MGISLPPARSPRATRVQSRDAVARCSEVSRRCHAAGDPGIPKRSHFGRSGSAARECRRLPSVSAIAPARVCETRRNSSVPPTAAKPWAASSASIRRQSCVRRAHVASTHCVSRERRRADDERRSRHCPRSELAAQTLCMLCMRHGESQTHPGQAVSLAERAQHDRSRRQSRHDADIRAAKSAKASSTTSNPRRCARLSATRRRSSAATMRPVGLSGLTTTTTRASPTSASEGDRCARDGRSAPRRRRARRRSGRAPQRRRPRSDAARSG